MTWSQFKSKVRTLLTVDAQRLNVSDYIDAQIRLAVIEIQSAVPAYQVGHETTYLVNDLVADVWASTGTLPEEAIATEAWICKIGAKTQREPVVPYPGGWRHRADLIAGNAQITDDQLYIVFNPLGKTVSSEAVGEGDSITYSRDRDFVLFPALDSDHELHVVWNGIKYDYQDTDQVPFDEAMSGCAAAYVKAEVVREVQKDVALFTSYRQSYLSSRSRLYLDAKDRKEPHSMPASPQAESNCANDYVEELPETAEENTV